MGFSRCRIRRWSCSTMLFMYCEQRTRRPKRGQISTHLQACDCPVLRLMAVQSNGMRISIGPGCLPEERFSSRYTESRAEEEVHCPAMLIHGAVQILPPGLHLHKQLIHTNDLVVEPTPQEQRIASGSRRPFREFMTSEVCTVTSRFDVRQRSAGRTARSMLTI
jgi:hypothetical protein